MKKTVFLTFAGFALVALFAIVGVQMPKAAADRLEYGVSVMNHTSNDVEVDVRGTPYYDRCIRSGAGGTVAKFDLIHSINLFVFEKGHNCRGSAELAKFRATNPEKLHATEVNVTESEGKYDFAESDIPFH